MENKLLNIIRQAIDGFKVKALSNIEPGNRVIESPKNDKVVRVSKDTIKYALTTICPKNIEKLKVDYLNHFEELRNLIPFCSSPSSFRTAWDLRSEKLNIYDAERIIQQGGQLIPANKENRIFQCVQQGVELGPNKRLILAVRHSEGNYDDELDDLGRFTYQPPRDTTGMLRYRLAQYISKKTKIDYILIAVMWFEYKISNILNQVFVIAPSKIIEFESDLKDLDKNLKNPLQLQLISRTQAYAALNLIFSLNETNIEIETRFELPDNLAREWSYDKIKNSKKGRQIKKWAQKSGKRCPGGCKTEFKDLSLSTIAFGHIISQNWSRAFTYIIDKVNHPDNLYLTCKSCNSSLNDNFPNRQLRDKILELNTIGDWLRENEKDIRKS